MFTKEEHNTLLTQLRSAETEADRVAIIVQLENDYTDTLTQHETAITTRDSAVKERDTYKTINNDMWLQLADQRKIGEDALTNNTHNSEPPQKLSFADLEAKMMEENRGSR
jgi:arginine deiminase